MSAPLGVRNVVVLERRHLAAGASGKSGALVRMHYAPAFGHAAKSSQAGAASGRSQPHELDRIRRVPDCRGRRVRALGQLRFLPFVVALTV
jgi:glycine/D-amino acid oxidase-like deaminating enzyme